MSLQAETAIKILEAVQTTLADKPLKLFEDVHTEKDTPLESFIHTMAKIKYLELVMVHSSAEAMQAKPELLRELSDDLLKVMLLCVTETKLVAPDILSKYYGSDLLASIVRNSPHSSDADRKQDRSDFEQTVTEVADAVSKSGIKE